MVRNVFYHDDFKGLLLKIMILLLLLIDLTIWFLIHFNETLLLTLNKSLIRIEQLLAIADMTHMIWIPMTPRIPILELLN